MFDVGWPELLVILTVALLVFGPQRMVELARTAGKALREFRGITDEFTGTFTDILKEETTPPPRDLPSEEVPAKETTAGPEPPTIAGPLTIPPAAYIPPDEYDSADLSMPPFPEEPDEGATPATTPAEESNLPTEPADPATEA